MVDGETNVALHDTIKATNALGGDPVDQDLGQRYNYHGGSATRDIYFVYTVPDLT